VLSDSLQRSRRRRFVDAGDAARLDGDRVGARSPALTTAHARSVATTAIGVAATVATGVASSTMTATAALTNAGDNSMLSPLGASLDEMPTLNLSSSAVGVSSGNNANASMSSSASADEAGASAGRAAGDATGSARAGASGGSARGAEMNTLDVLVRLRNLANDFVSVAEQCECV
jgi:hypothetical protein